MITFDVVWFGYGAGLVLCGWFAGVVVAVVLGVLGRIGKLGCALLVAGLLCSAGSGWCQASGTVPNLYWASWSGTAGAPVTVGVQVSCSQDSLGTAFPYGSGGAPVSWACPGSAGSVTVPVGAVADSGGNVVIGVMGDQYTTGASVTSNVPGNSPGALVCFIVGALTASAFAYAAGGKFL
jgi:hypothetical protein